jgi:phenylalanyl-tRNA synthetase alpha chain
VKKAGSTTSADIDAALGAAVSKVGFGAAMKNKWVAVDKATKAVTAAVQSAPDTVREDLQKLKDGKGIDKSQFEALKKRKLAQVASVTSYKAIKSDNFSLDLTKKAADITLEMITKGTWETTEFKEYNLTALGSALGGGHLHPLLKVRAEIRNILLLMGFEEMPTNQFVESSFWNFDTLYQPQQHPARDAHDTFFIKSPALAQNIPQDYLKRVKDMHEIGGQGSTGWKYDWSEDESRKNLLRTHTTAVSSRMLYKMGQKYKETGVFTPKKYFSIDRVFRNETLDATHLAEFHQVEGFVADRGLGLGHLIGIIREFFRRMGITNLRFKPAYNPYTEPSMEIFGFHPMLKKWIELGNSGVFRPEMLNPMELPEDISVIAWGISVERPTMIQYGIPNIRDLFGFKQDIAALKKNAVCWVKAAETL